MDPAMLNQVRHLYEVERLSQRQVAQKLGISRKRVSRLLHPESLKKPFRETIFQSFERLVREWYREYPFLKRPRSMSG